MARSINTLLALLLLATALPVVPAQSLPAAKQVVSSAYATYTGWLRDPGDPVWYLWLDKGIAAAAYNTKTDEYRVFDAQSWTWGPSTVPPWGRKLNFGVAEKQLGTRAAKPDPFREARGEPKVEPKPNSKAEPIQNFGVELSKLHSREQGDGNSYYLSNADGVRSIPRDEALRLAGSSGPASPAGTGATGSAAGNAGGNLSDDSALLRLTSIGSDLAQVGRDLASVDSLKPIRDQVLYQHYDSPDAPLLKGLGFVRGLYLQQPDGAVVWRMASYPGPNKLALAVTEAIRKPQPYDPARDQDASKPSLPGPLKNVPLPVAAGGGLLVLYMLWRNRQAPVAGPPAPRPAVAPLVPPTVPPSPATPLATPPAVLTPATLEAMLVAEAQRRQVEDEEIRARAKLRAESQAALRSLVGLPPASSAAPTLPPVPGSGPN